MKRSHIVLVLACAAVVALLVMLLRSRRDAEPERATGTVDRRAAMRTVLPPILPSPATVVEASDMSISGVVVSRLDGSPVSGAELTFSNKGQVFSVTSLTEGDFAFVAPEPGTYQLTSIEAGGYLSFAPAWGDSPLELVARPGFHIKGVVLRLEPTVNLAVRVTDPAGQPVPSATISLAAPTTMNTAFVALGGSQLTDASGAAHVTVPVGAIIKVECAGFTSRHDQVSLEVWKRGELTVQLAREQAGAAALLSIAGRVVDGKGSGMVDLVVTARPVRENAFSDELRWWRARSGADGKFAITGLAPGSYTLTAASPGLVPARLDNVAAGTTDAVLQLTDQGGSIAGDVVSDGDGKPVGAFVVILSQPVGKVEERPIDTRSVFDAQGKFVVGPLAPGRYLLRVTAHGHAASRAQSVEVTAGGTARVQIRLPAGGSIEGVVRDAATRRGIGGALLVLDGSAGVSSLPLALETSAVAGSDGGFRLTGVPQGLRSLTATADGYNGRVTSGIEVNEARATQVEIELGAVPPGEVAKVELTGIGAGLAGQGDALLIGDVIAGGGAAEAGLVKGDLIVAIGTTQVVTLDLNGATQMIRGPVGTTVTLRVKSRDQPERSVVVTRRLIRLPATPQQ